MYLEHFGLREAPFRLTPLSDFFFTGARRGATVEAIMYAVEHEEGIVKISGEVGTGKTMLCRVLIERLPDSTDTIYLANPSLDPGDLLRTLATELGLTLTGEPRGAMLPAIQEVLIARHAAGRRVVLMIDEAHAMPKASLEQVRLLSNLETGRHKLLQLVLFGQPELDTLLAARDMRQLKDRITHHFRLAPLSAADVTDYLDFRMRTAGYRGPAVFSPAATRRIARYSSGLTRRINVLADKALLAAYTMNMHVINPSHVRTAAIDAEYLGRRQTRPPWWLVAGLFAAAGVIAWQQLRTPSGTPAGAAREPAAPKVTAPAVTAQPPAAQAPPGAATAERARSTPDAAAVSKPTSLSRGADRREAAPAIKPVAERVVAAATARPAGTPTPPRQVETPAAVAAADGAAPARMTPASADLAPPGAAPADETASAAPATTVDTRFGPLANAALAAQARWMESAADDTWFIQLHTNTGIDAAGLERQIGDTQAALPGEQIRLYSATVGENTRTGVIVGSFNSEREALAAIRALPAQFRAAGAYVRQARRLR